VVIAKIIGEIVSSAKVDRLVGQKFLLVEVQRIDYKSETQKVVPTGNTLVVNDPVGAGRGELVLVVQGSSARMTDITATVPTDGIIIGIVDSVNVGQDKVYRKDQSVD
jgi:ethanolamine utilization protein EutN